MDFGPNQFAFHLSDDGKTKEKAVWIFSTDIPLWIISRWTNKIQTFWEYPKIINEWNFSSELDEESWETEKAGSGPDKQERFVVGNFRLLG